MATRTSTRTAAASGEVTRNRNVAPSATPGSAAAVVTRLGPSLAAAAAFGARRANRHLDRHDEAVKGLAFRQQDLGAVHFAADSFAEERVAHAFDDSPHGGEVDGDLVGKAFVRHRSVANDRSRSSGCQGNAPMLAFSQ
jgi:hypothetical protein